MYKLLIVDDDTLVRMFLRNFFPWKEKGYQIVGDARDGEEAAELTAHLQPDLILTDISMPGMGGIAFISALREKKYDGGILVLSCHDDFGYVKEAMRLGADEYVLKNHLDEETLGEALERVTDAMRRRRAEAEGRHALHRMAEKGSRLTQRELLQSLLARETSWEEQYRETQAVGLRYRYYRCAVLLAAAQQGDSLREQGLYEACRHVAGGYTAEVIDLERTRYAILYDFSDTPSASRQNEVLAEQSASLHSFVRDYLAADCHISVSEVCEGGGSIARALRQAREAAQEHFYGKEIVRYDGRAPMGSQVPAPALAFCEELPACLRKGDGARLQSGFHAALDAFRAERVQIGVLLSWLKQCDTAAGLTRDEPFYASIICFADCAACLSDYQSRMREMSLPAGLERLSPAIARAICYTRAHFAEPIGLGHVAREVGLSIAYLSRAFKQEVGVGFSEYLLGCRLEQVQRQLTESLDTIGQIAARAGFQDYQHFCKMFKKKLGVSPAQYRKERQANR